MLIKTINLMVALLTAILIFVLMAESEAKVTGVCSNCHTMHNSQGGAAVVKDAYDTAQDTPVEFLLNRGGGSKTTCWGCHAQTTALNILTLIPQIRHTNATDLAGGNFGYIATVDNQGHNVIDYTDNPETTLTGAPPGDENSNTVTGLTLTCAGANGCHGDRTVTGVGASMKGAHHTNDNILKFGASFTLTGQGASTGLSYRFLKGVKGAEETNWLNSSSTVHNEYIGTTTGGVSEDSTISSPGAAGAISGLCAECHGNFHGGSVDIGGPTGTPWLRHPTDITLPSSGEYTSYTAYSVTAPVARTTIADGTTTPSSTVTPSGNTNDIVMCLSCHRAHASANFKMTIWDYKSATLATALTGCNVCHTSKN